MRLPCCSMQSTVHATAREQLTDASSLCRNAIHRLSMLLPMQMGTWCSGITSASHAEGPGFKSQCVHFSTGLSKKRLPRLSRTTAHSKSTRGGTRTRNLLLRREAPYPLGHTSSYRSLPNMCFIMLSDRLIVFAQFLAFLCLILLSLP